ncbi:unnamed protein product [Clavelina lepadiformis]|uniref:Uncharacterized protein n=1 Tax=Clavelina lepadiformis TaxID=159417 RepID=A0ABP0FL12_CLALP
MHHLSDEEIISVHEESCSTGQHKIPDSFSDKLHQIKIRILGLSVAQVLLGGVSIIMGIMSSGIYGPWAGVWVILTALQVAAKVFSKKYRKWRVSMHIVFYVIAVIGCCVTASCFLYILTRHKTDPALELSDYTRATTVTLVVISFVEMLLCLASTIQYILDFNLIVKMADQQNVNGFSTNYQHTEAVQMTLFPTVDVDNNHLH